ncbi:MAG TPA: hypothetical protein VLB80_04855 [Candidatus Babeliales bacterium]|nr:hypothetical protein [Candidatus Babeliales bacterium]
MKQYSKKLFSLVVLYSAITNNIMLQADNDNGNHVVPFLQWRSQGRDTARKLYGTTSYAVYQGDIEGTYGTFNATVQYDQSFRGKNLAHCLFGNSLTSNTTTPTTNLNRCDNDCDDSSILTISGLNQPTGTTRAATEWMAENFYLARDFKSTISFRPKVQDVVVDFNLFVGFDRWCTGLYFRLYGPVVWNRASLHAEETVINKGTATTGFDPATGNVTAIGGGYTEGYFDPNTAVQQQSLFQNALSFFGGCELPKYPRQEVVAQPLMFAKFSDCIIPGTNPCDDDCGSSRQHKTGFAELRGEFGWNYIQEKYRLLLNIQAAAPTGTRPNAEFLFPAQIGNGKHWELGVGVGGSWTMWNSEDGDKSFSFIVEADVTHLFKAKQKRTFDLKGKPNSRYMLAEQLITTSPANLQLVPNTPQFNVQEGQSGIYSPVANFSTRDVKVSIGAQGDVVAMFNYTFRGFSWDLGYNFWGMSASKISLSDDCDDSCGVVPFPANTWALKGDASIAGYTADGTVFFGLGATESKATIFTGTNVGTTTPLANTGIDNAALAVGAPIPPATTNTDLFVFGGTVTTPSTTRINTSVQPIFISATDFDIEGAEQRGISHKVFTHFSYTWTDRDRWVPYVGAGFSAEFGSHSGSDDDCPTTTVTTTNNCPSSASCALSKWAVEVKGGISFH